MLAIVPSATVLGVEGRPVSVEVHVSNGLPSFTIVGLPDTACREARDRVRAALLCTGLPWPMRRITVNLAPSGLRKVGSGLDLAIAVAMLIAEEQVEPSAIEGLGFLGELGLDGSLRAVPGMVSLVEALPTATAVVPAAAAGEARLVARHEVRAVRNLGEVVAVLKAEDAWPDPPPPGTAPPPPPPPDLADVRGQPVARLALEVAAAGHHHLLMVGPPGSGKTMLARRLPGLLPELSREHALEVTRIHSAAGLPLRTDSLIWRPPLRAPHHNASPVSVIGGGTALMRPGEVSLAHPRVQKCAMTSGCAQDSPTGRPCVRPGGAGDVLPSSGNGGCQTPAVTFDGRACALLNYYLLAGLKPPTDVVQAAAAMVARHTKGLCRCRWCRSGDRDRWAEVLGVD